MSPLEQLDVSVGSGEVEEVALDVGEEVTDAVDGDPPDNRS